MSGHFFFGLGNGNITNNDANVGKRKIKNILLVHKICLTVIVYIADLQYILDHITSLTLYSLVSGFKGELIMFTNVE